MRDLSAQQENLRRVIDFRKNDDEGIAPGRPCETHETRVRPAVLSCNPGVAQPLLPVPEPP